MANELMFTGDIVKGTIDMNKAEMVCVSKFKYKTVELCLKTGDDGKSGWNLAVANIFDNALSFDEKIKLGKEIERRWNNR